MEKLYGLKDSIPLSFSNIRKGMKGIMGQYVLAIGIVSIMLISASPTLAQAVPGFSETDSAEEVNENEILWFARTLYSETKVPEEQLLVAWVIRNRVESSKFPNTYEGVVRQKGQFSGLSPRDAQYWTNISLDLSDEGPGWDSAVKTARAVYSAGGTLRPISAGVFHFYSPMSVSAHPKWASDVTPVHIVRSKKSGSVRFAFYANIR